MGSIRATFSAERIINVLVKCNSQNRKVAVPADATVAVIMSTISESFGLLADGLKLIFRGKDLSLLDSPLSSFGFRDNSRVLLIGSPQPSDDASPSISPPPPLFDFSTRQLRILNDEYMTAPPHSIIVKKGPPDGVIEGSDYQLDAFPAPPFIVHRA
jgi:hypothetical protein